MGSVRSEPVIHNNVINNLLLLKVTLLLTILPCSALNELANDGEWRYLGNVKVNPKSDSTGYTEWFLSKDHLQVGDMVRTRKLPNSCRPQNMDIPEGTVVSLEGNTDQKFALVRVHGNDSPIRFHVSSLERVTSGLLAGDWVGLRDKNEKHSPVGILHAINLDGSVSVGFLGLRALWEGNSSQLEKVTPYCVGQFVRIKETVSSPRFGWCHKKGSAWGAGKISWILPNGGLVIKFPGMLPFGNEANTYMADPYEVEVVEFSTCPGIIEKYQHVEDHHWAIRPVLVAFGLFTAFKFGILIGKKVRRNKVNAVETTETSPNQNAKSVATTTTATMRSPNATKQGNAIWVPTVASVIFKEGGKLIH